MIIPDLLCQNSPFSKISINFQVLLLFIRNSTLQSFLILQLQVKSNIKEDVERCLEAYNPDEEPECFVQAYYQKMQTNPHLKLVEGGSISIEKIPENWLFQLRQPFECMHGFLPGWHGNHYDDASVGHIASS